jgi:folate-binding protein YgfZ
MYRGFVDGGRAVLRLTGGAAREVLQGVVTSDVGRVAPGRAVYAALLTPQGKYLFDFFLLDGGNGGGNGDGNGVVLIDVARGRAAALAERLKMYCLRRDARVEGEAPLSVALLWPDSAEGHDHPAAPNWAPNRGMAVPDPRAGALGWRIYAEKPEIALADTGAAPADRGEYDALRVEHLVPETGVELVPEETFILEAGFERLHGVDFRKGCYVGQEVTARMKHKATLRKGLVLVAVEGEARPGTEVTAEGKPAGTLFTVANGRGLAHLRLDRAGPGMRAGAARVDYAG